jgi:hypothetical protein
MVGCIEAVILQKADLFSDGQTELSATQLLVFIYIVQEEGLSLIFLFSISFCLTPLYPQ